MRNRPAGLPARGLRGRSGGVGRSTSDAAEAVSDALRRQTDPFLDRRRRIAGLTLGAMGSLGMVAAYQFGLIRHLPEPPLPGLDADRVDGSGEAYQLFKTPDAAVGLASYAATLVLVGMGDARRSSTRRWLPLAMLAKVAGDAAFGLFLTVEQGSKHRRFCSWCLLAATVSLATVPQALPEAAAALRPRRRRA